MCTLSLSTPGDLESFIQLSCPVLGETSYQLKIFVSQNPGTQFQYPDVWGAFTLGNHRQ